MDLEFVSLESEDAPPVAHHVAEPLNGKIFVHGGLKHVGAQPCKDLWRFYPDKNKWVIESKEGPSLSHHAAFTENDRLLHLVGGFDGKYRVSNVWTYDYRAGDWIKGKTEGFPSGGGLSSHTLTACRREGEAVITGRLGGARQQRRNAAVLRLQISGGKGRSDWIYTDLAMGIESRSGHSATPISSSQIAILGGRTGKINVMDTEIVSPGPRFAITMPRLDKQISKNARYTRSRSRSIDSRMGSRRTPSSTSAMRSRIGSVGDVHSAIKLSPPREWTKPTDKCGRPLKCSARKYHIALPNGDGGVMVHGGERFSNEKQPLSDAWLWQGGDWRQIQAEGVLPALTGHKGVFVNDKFFIVGGHGQDFLPSRTIYTFEAKV